jgi:hypothetical protein|nr:MAG TPA: hypothetical protein [Caudoviricetes sp.]
MSTKSKKIKNSTKGYSNLKKDLEKQSTDTILEWKIYFNKLKDNVKCDTGYFVTAIKTCDEILKERRKK